MKEDIRQLQQQITELIQAFEDKHDINVESVSVVSTEYPYGIRSVKREYLTSGVKIGIKM